MSELLKPNRVAEMLDISVKTVYEWAKLDKIPSVRLFDEVRFRKEVIEDICKNGLQKPETMNNIVRPKIKKKQELRKVGLWEKLREKSAG